MFLIWGLESSISRNIRIFFKALFFSRSESYLLKIFDLRDRMFYFPKYKSCIFQKYKKNCFFEKIQEIICGWICFIYYYFSSPESSFLKGSFKNFHASKYKESFLLRKYKKFFSLWAQKFDFTKYKKNIF